MSSPTQDADSRTLVLYGTAHCHLCEQALAVLQRMPGLLEWMLEWIDIADDDALLARYGTLIPVLRWPAGDCELCWPFGAAEVQAMLPVA